MEHPQPGKPISPDEHALDDMANRGLKSSPEKLGAWGSSLPATPLTPAHTDDATTWVLPGVSLSFMVAPAASQRQSGEELSAASLVSHCSWGFQCWLHCLGFMLTWDNESLKCLWFPVYKMGLCATGPI